MNKVLLILIIISGFLVIFYANSEIFSRKTLLAVFQRSSNEFLSTENFTAEIKRVKYTPRHNDTEYNIFVIYTKENYQLQKKFELFAKSLIKYTSVRVHLHIITDEKSEVSAEELLREQINRYKKTILYTFYDVHECAEKVSDIVHAMMPYFSSNPGSYYSDALFYLSLGLHRIVDPHMRRAILIDCDVVFRTDVRFLFNEFHKFSSDNLFGLAPELTPVYRHILYRYRANYPNTNFGSPYYPSSVLNSKHKHKHIKHGYPGLNSGVVMLDFKRIRESKLYLENLKEIYVRKIANKYSFKGHLGDQDYYTLLGYEFPSLIYRLDCVWNRQLCTWWKDHGYSDVFDTYFHCEGKVKVYHGNCNTRVPE